LAYSADIFISPQSLLVIKYFGEAVLPPRLLCLEATAPLPPSHATAARLREFPRRHEAVLLAVYTCRNADVWGVRTDNVCLHKQASRTTLDTLPRPHPSLSVCLSVCLFLRGILFLSVAIPAVESSVLERLSFLQRR